MEKCLQGTRNGCQTGMRCERELSVFDSKVLRDSTEVATRDMGTGLWLWRASECCTTEQGTLHSCAPQLVLHVLSPPRVPVTPLPGSLLHTESQEDVAGDGEGQVAEVATAPE